MQHQVTSLPRRVITSGPPMSGVQRVVKWITNILALLGLVLVSGLLLLYFQGQQAVRAFDKEFISFFGKFVEQVLTQDVATALIIKIPLEPQVTIEQAIASMNKYAEQLNFQLLTRYSLHQKIADTTGQPHRFIEVFQFCEASVAPTLLEYNPDLATYLPYRVALYKDSNEQLWFATLNLNLLLHGAQEIDPMVKAQLLKVQDNLLKMMGVGAHGTL